MARRSLSSAMLLCVEIRPLRITRVAALPPTPYFGNFAAYEMIDIPLLSRAPVFVVRSKTWVHAAFYGEMG
jgi:hypothetical protein